ncbi:MAG: ATP-binding cassette domain-containing protein [Nitrososphaerota archaeon]
MSNGKREVYGVGMFSLLISARGPKNPMKNIKNLYIGGFLSFYSMIKYLVEMKNIWKSFGDIIALRGVDFYVKPNEIVGLIGDNGAGKSTLIKILTGVYPPDKGEIYINGEKIDIKKYSVKKAREFGIETVYQERALAEQQTLWRNVFMGREKITRFGFLKIKDMKQETDKLLRWIGLTSSAILSDLTTVKTLSGGEKQGVAIARALYFKANLIVLDEPTVGLSITETEKVLEFVRKIKEEGKSSIFITHNIYHVYPVADRFVILDRGKNIGEYYKKDISLEELTEKLRKVAMIIK